MKVHYREAEDRDFHFIYSSWLKGYRNSDECKYISNDVYYAGFKNIIADILGRAKIIIACNPEDKDQLYGYIVHEDRAGLFILHYVYVKYTFRKLKIGKTLVGLANPVLGQEPMLVSHANHIYEKNKDKYQLIYNPFLRSYYGKER